MTVTEFSSQFDVLYNNIMSNQAPGLDEYEKSVFLTKAQDEILKNYLNPKGNKYAEGFDGNQKRQIDFSMVMRQVSPAAYTAGDAANYVKIDGRSKAYRFPADALIILNENLVEKTTVSGSTNTKYYVVVPISFQEYTRLMNKPYKLPVKSQAWRLLSASASTLGSETALSKNLYVELIGNFTTGSALTYTVRYVKRPSPIILVNLDDNYSNVSICGQTSAQTCELDPILHEEILQRAVELAKAAYTGDASTATTMGQRSE